MKHILEGVDRFLTSDRQSVIISRQSYTTLMYLENPFPGLDNVTVCFYAYIYLGAIHR